jgi:predicted MPP superfamily phosphohydrolase
MTRKDTICRSRQPDQRTRWKNQRILLEKRDFKNWSQGSGGFWIYKYKHQAILLFGALLKATGFFKHGHRNAMNIQVRHVDVFPKALPESFRGYRILHLSDLHLDSMEGIGERIARKIEPLSCDLCVITGDFRYARHGAYKQILPPLRKIVSAVNPTDGIHAVLGNHDTQAMVEDVETLGIRLLTNETRTICRDGQHLHIIGVDDPHDYYTENAAECVTNAPRDGFRILLAHSPELYPLADANAVGLYLCGHSHGGQICLPGGLPLMTCLDRGKRFYRGVWKYGNVVGHTSPGCGTAKIPIRFNCNPETTVLTLKK